VWHNISDKIMHKIKLE